MEVRKRIELIQDFEMPAISDRLKVSVSNAESRIFGNSRISFEKVLKGIYNLLSQVSNDGQYVLATGIYKPRLRCYDLHNLGMKFERCLDSEVNCVQTQTLQVLFL